MTPSTPRSRRTTFTERNGEPPVEDASDESDDSLLRYLEWLRDASPEDLEAAEQEQAARFAELALAWRVFKVGAEYTILDRQGKVYADQMRHLPPEFKSLAVVTDAPAPPASVNPQLETNSEPPPPAAETAIPPRYVESHPNQPDTWRRW